ncbi:MAG: chromosome segregation protein SMC, partial [bacterium]
MYLKALELHGFKSFPEKTRLTFEKPVTAIVGPNGSGKSNISDALMWVMGEQSSKALRGGKMEDVIFGGTERRSQMGYAEVTLVLDNADGGLAVESDEVEVTRRYYRSGESEYCINRKVVRLRDVNELFMDTGLGRDGYSNIGQGKVDSILSAKSTDRREIFEEAAGISRYRHRKEESERKLQRAEDDLLRVNDKIAELELQVEPLRKQSETAKKYLLLRDELRGLEISLWLHDLEELAQKNEKIRQDALTASGALEKARQELDALYAAGEEFTRRMQEKDAEAEALREKISAKEAEVAELDSRCAVLRTELGNNKTNIERLRGELSRQEDQNQGIARQTEEHRRRVEEIHAERGEKEATLALLTRDAETLSASETESQQRLIALSRSERETADAASALKTELSAGASSLQEVEDRESALLAEISAETDRLAGTKTEEDAHAALLQKAREAAEEKRNVARGYALRVEARQKRVDEAQEKVTNVRMEENAAQSRLTMLSDMERDHEGYSRAVKTVVRETQRGTLRGVHGPVGDLVKTEDKYALAVETALGAAMQNIIVSTENDGKAVINLLKRLDAGRLTLLPMNVIRGTRLQEAGLEGERGFEGIAFDLVRCDRQYEGIFLNLLGRTAVAETMDDAIAIARRHGHRFRIVTLDGQLINAGGSMTGGSINKNTGILSRANEIQALKERTAMIQEKLGGLTAALDAAKRELAQAVYENGIEQDALRAAEDRVVKLTGEESRFAALLTALEGRIAQLRQERETS